METTQSIGIVSIYVAVKKLYENQLYSLNGKKKVWLPTVLTNRFVA